MCLETHCSFIASSVCGKQHKISCKLSSAEENIEYFLSYIKYFFFPTSYPAVFAKKCDNTNKMKTFTLPQYRTRNLWFFMNLKMGKVTLPSCLKTTFYETFVEEAESINKFSSKPKFVSKYLVFCLLNEFPAYEVNRFIV